MTQQDLHECSPLLQAIYSQMDPCSPSQRLVVWPKNPLVGSSCDADYVSNAHDPDSLLIDPEKIPGYEQQMSLLEKNNLLENGCDHRVKVITAKLNGDLAKWNADLSVNREVVHTLEDFQSLKALWERFDVDPMNGFDWNHSWWKAFQDSGDLHLMTFERDGEVVGIAPFFVDRWMKLKRFRFLASGNVCSDYVDIICDPEHYELCGHQLAKYIEAMNFDIVELDCTKGNRLAQVLQQHLDQRFQCDQREAEPTWRLNLPESWKEFVSGTKKSLRRKINKSIRRIDSGEVTMSSTSEGLDVDSAFEILKDLHTLRFNSMDKPGVFADDRFTEFLQSAVTEFCRQGKGEIVVASREGKPFAAHLYFESKEGFQFYQGGADPEAMKLEPGHLVFTWMVKRALERGDRVFDFLRGNEPYKKFWGASTVPQWKTRLVSKRILPTVVYKAIKLGRRFRGSDDA